MAQPQVGMIELVSVVIGLLHYIPSEQKLVVKKPESTEASNLLI
jgi:hypothetical protein